MDSQPTDLIIICKCRRCGLEKPAHKDEQHLCEDCVRLENNRYSYIRQANRAWMEVSKDAGLEYWERQPKETDLEWRIWLEYRDMYPAKKPTYRGVAEKLGTTYGAVAKIAARWDFTTRIQAWAKYVDELTMSQRRQEIMDMNKEHIDMAQKLRDKLKKAIDLVDPTTLKPSELQGLFKLVTDIERKARLDEPIAPAVSLSDDNPALKKAPTKVEDLSTIVGILSKSGVLPSGAQVGVRHTTTTELVVKDMEEGD